MPKIPLNIAQNVAATPQGKAVQQRAQQMATPQAQQLYQHYVNQVRAKYPTVASVQAPAYGYLLANPRWSMGSPNSDPATHRRPIGTIDPAELQAIMNAMRARR